MENVKVVVPWHNEEVKDKFVKAWGEHPSLLLQRDAHGDGSARTKNLGVEKAVELGAEVVIILDSDMMPKGDRMTLDDVISCHLSSLKPKTIEMFKTITTPPSRGTPYFNREMEIPVACSLGWWDLTPDRDAARQLIEGATAPMIFNQEPIFGRWFAGSGMNIAFRPKEWFPWCSFVEGVGRYDDIWMFYLWAKEAYRRGYCFSFYGPTLIHSRQSNVFNNLKDESENMEKNETVWMDIAKSDYKQYHSLKALLPTRY